MFNAFLTIMIGLGVFIILFASVIVITYTKYANKKIKKDKVKEAMQMVVKEEH